MLRVCGATGERSARDARQCWCRGVFCGRGGARASLNFWRDLRTRKVANTPEQFSELVRQGDLFDGGAIADTWRSKIFDAALIPAARPRPALAYSRDEFERDRHGETGDAYRAARAAGGNNGR